MTADTPSPEAKPRRRMGKKAKIILIIASLLMMGFLRTGFLFIIIAMMPSIVMYYVDVSRKRYMFKTIFACNLSGLMPFIGKMVTWGPSSIVMQDIMGTGTNWVIIYGSALMGLLMIRTAPTIAHTLISGFHQTQIAMLGRYQKRIEMEWGEEVTQFSKKEDEDDGWF